MLFLLYTEQLADQTVWNRPSRPTYLINNQGNRWIDSWQSLWQFSGICMWRSVAYLAKEANTSLDEQPLKFSDGLAKLGLISLVK